MRILNAIVKPFKLDDVIEGFEHLGIKVFNVSDVNGYNQSEEERYGSSGYHCKYLPKVHVMAFVSENQVILAKDMIIKSARTGKVYDGMVWDIPLDGYTNISTGEEVNDS